MTIELPDEIGKTLLERLVAALETMAAGAAQNLSDNVANALGSPLLTKAEVGRQIRKSPREVERLVKAGKLRKVQNMGRAVRFRQADVDRFVAPPEVRELGKRRL